MTHGVSLPGRLTVVADIGPPDRHGSRDGLVKWRKLDQNETQSIGAAHLTAGPDLPQPEEKPANEWRLPILANLPVPSRGVIVVSSSAVPAKNDPFRNPSYPERTHMASRSNSRRRCAPGSRRSKRPPGSSCPGHVDGARPRNGSITRRWVPGPVGGSRAAVAPGDRRPLRGGSRAAPDGRGGTGPVGPAVGGGRLVRGWTRIAWFERKCARDANRWSSGFSRPRFRLKPDSNNENPSDWASGSRRDRSLSPLCLASHRLRGHLLQGAEIELSRSQHGQGRRPSRSDRGGG